MKILHISLVLVVAVLLIDHNNGQGPTDNNTNKRVQYDHDAMSNKKDNQGLSFWSIAEAYCVPHVTLYNYTKLSKPYVPLINRTIHNVDVTKEQESELVQYFTYMAHRGWLLILDPVAEWEVI